MWIRVVFFFFLNLWGEWLCVLPLSPSCPRWGFGWSVILAQLHVFLCPDYQGIWIWLKQILWSLSSSLPSFLLSGGICNISLKTVKMWTAVWLGRLGFSAWVCYGYPKPVWVSASGLVCTLTGCLLDACRCIPDGSPRVSYVTSTPAVCITNDFVKFIRAHEDRDLLCVCAPPPLLLLLRWPVPRVQHCGALHP